MRFISTAEVASPELIVEMLFALDADLRSESPRGVASCWNLASRSCSEKAFGFHSTGAFNHSSGLTLGGVFNRASFVILGWARRSTVLFAILRGNGGGDSSPDALRCRAVELAETAALLCSTALSTVVAFPWARRSTVLFAILRGNGGGDSSPDALRCRAVELAKTIALLCSTALSTVVAFP